MGEDEQAKARHERRAWIAAHHPDRGGDPDEFADGLRRWTPSPPTDTASQPIRVSVYRSRSPWRRIRRFARRLRQSPAQRSRRLL